MTLFAAFLLGVVVGAIGMTAFIVWLLSWAGAVVEEEFDWREAA